MGKKKSVLLLAMIGLGVALFLTAYFGILRDKFRSGIILSKTLNSQAALLNLYESEAQIFNKMHRNVSFKNLKNSTSQFKGRLPVILGSISALAKAESISLNHFELGRTTLFNQKFHQTPVYIKSIGSYDNITSFLKKVSLLAGVISLGDFTMTVENERYDASQLLSAVFTINLYSLSKELKINISGGSS